MPLSRRTLALLGVLAVGLGACNAWQDRAEFAPPQSRWRATEPSPASADAPPPPYIDHTEWVHWADLSSLRVYPTPAGRLASTEFVKPDEAWSEVLADAPDADLPGMRDQFVCHWELAEAAEPGKTSWNLEP